jgi:hypothetical protein
MKQASVYFRIILLVSPFELTPRVAGHNFALKFGVEGIHLSFHATVDLCKPLAQVA